MGVGIQKKTCYPAYREHKIEYDVAGLEAAFEARHLREEDGALVCAEGAQRVYFVARILNGVYSIRDELFFWSTSASQLIRITEGGETGWYSMWERPACLIPFTDRDGKQYLFAVVRNQIVVIDDAGQSQVVFSGKGGVCGALFKERLFTASGSRISYTAPLDPTNWEETRGNGGYIDLPDPHRGNFIGAVALREQLFFFREHGIVQLKVNGDDFNFKAIPVKFDGETIVPSTIADCGDAVLFFTDRGLYSFSGGKCTLLEHTLFPQIEGAPSNASARAGNYYAVCTHRTFGNVVYCYDRTLGKAHFIAQRGECTAAGNSLWTHYGSAIYRFDSKGLPASGSCCLCCEETDLGLLGSERMLEGATVEGRGKFTFSVRTEQGLEYSAEGNAGEKLHLPAVVRGGKFTLTLQAEGVDFCIRKLTLYAKETSYDN